MSAQQPDILHPLVSLEWDECKELPLGTNYAQAIWINDKLCVGAMLTEGSRRDHARLYIYSRSQNSWSTVDTPVYYFAMTIYKDKLVIVNGRKFIDKDNGGPVTDKVLTINKELDQWEVVKGVPHMNTKRCATCVVSVDHYLIVAGGYIDSGFMSDIVEVFNGCQWVYGTNLPVSSVEMKSVVHDGVWYLMGGRNQKRNVFCTSLKDFQSKGPDTSSEPLIVWKVLDSQLQYERSSPAIFGNRLVAIGGERDFPGSQISTSTIHAYSEYTKSWVHVGDLPQRLHSSCTVVLPTGELMVIGGMIGYATKSKKVYVSTFKESLSEVFTFAALTQLEKREGIPVLTQLEAKNHEFQTIIRVKQSDASWAINKWLTTPVLSRIKPMWKSLLCVLRLINLDHLADDIEAYSKKHSLSSLGEDKGGVIEKLRDELLALCDKLKEGDDDENVHHLKKIKTLSKSAIKEMKEEPVSLVDIKQRQPSPAPPQPVTAGKTRMIKTEPASPSMITPTEETALTATKKQLLADMMSVYTAVADGDISVELSDMLRRRVQEMRDQLALVEPPGEVVDIKPTSPAQTATMTTQSHVLVKEEPPEDVLTSTTVYSSFDAADDTESEMEIQALGSSLALVPPPRGVIETPPTSSGQLAGFRGVEVCAEITVVITNDPQSFAWEGYGLKIHIPKGCLPAGMEQCTINIKASLAGQYEFPKNTHLVSAIFWLYCEPRCKFVVPVSLEIQHCARPENISKLIFVKAFCSQESLPYTFRRQQGGCFTSSSSYGVLELESFSGVGTVQEGSEDREYIARLFYQSQKIGSYDIHMVVTWNIDTYLTAVELKYSRALPGPDQPVDFESDQIKLDIPEDGISLPGGWRITPLTAPVVTKKHVDNYHPGKRIPSCQLLADFDADSAEVKMVPFRYRVKLLGARKPHDMFTIIPPTSSMKHDTEHHSSPSSVSLPATKRSHTPPAIAGPSQKKFKMMSQPSDVDSEPANKDLPIKPKLKDLLEELYIKAAGKWEDIGVLLEIEDGKLEQIKTDNVNDSRACLREMLRIWLNRVDPPPSWSAIAGALERLGDENLATHLTSKYCN